MDETIPIWKSTCNRSVFAQLSNSQTCKHLLLLRQHPGILI